MYGSQISPSQTQNPRNPKSQSETLPRTTIPGGRAVVPYFRYQHSGPSHTANRKKGVNSISPLGGTGLKGLGSSRSSGSSTSGRLVRLVPLLLLQLLLAGAPLVAEGSVLAAHATREGLLQLGAQGERANLRALVVRDHVALVGQTRLLQASERGVHGVHVLG